MQTSHSFTATRSCVQTMAECKPFPEYIWTATCVPFCENPHGGTGPEGCYDIDEHKCECGTTEDQCKDKPKYGEKWFWTPGCSSCAGKSSGSAEFYIE